MARGPRDVAKALHKGRYDIQSTRGGGLSRPDAPRSLAVWRHGLGVLAAGKRRSWLRELLDRGRNIKKLEIEGTMQASDRLQNPLPIGTVGCRSRDDRSLLPNGILRLRSLPASAAMLRALQPLE